MRINRGEKENGIDVENLLHKMLEEDPDMASNPLANYFTNVRRENPKKHNHQIIE